MIVHNICIFRQNKPSKQQWASVLCTFSTKLILSSVSGGGGGGGGGVGGINRVTILY